MIISNERTQPDLLTENRIRKSKYKTNNLLRIYMYFRILCFRFVLRSYLAEFIANRIIKKKNFQSRIWHLHLLLTTKTVRGFRNEKQEQSIFSAFHRKLLYLYCVEGVSKVRSNLLWGPKSLPKALFKVVGESAIRGNLILVAVIISKYKMHKIKKHLKSKFSV